MNIRILYFLEYQVWLATECSTETINVLVARFAARGVTLPQVYSYLDTLIACSPLYTFVGAILTLGRHYYEQALQKRASTRLGKNHWLSSQESLPTCHCW